MSLHKLSILGSLVFGCWSIAVVRGADVEFTVEGEVRLSRLNHPKGVLVSDPITRFKLSRKNSSWFLSSYRLDKPDGYQEAAYDGTQLYYINSFFGGSSSKAPPPAGGGPDNVAEAWLYKGTEVLHSMFMLEAGPIWLMFCSDNLLKASSGGMIEPIATMGVGSGVYKHTTPFKQRAEWALCVAEPKLPSHVVFYDDGLVRRDDLKVPARRQPPYDAGFTNVVYNLLSQTNVAGLTIPLQAVFEVLRPHPEGQAASDLLKICRFEISASHVRPTCDVVDFRPKVPGITVMSDTRVDSRLGAFGYKSKEWLSESEVLKTREYLQRASLSLQGKVITRESSGLRRWLMIVMAAIVSVPVIILLVNKQRKDVK